MAMQCCVAPIAPDIANMMVPQCETNPQYQFCTEGESCGKHPRLQDALATATQKQSEDVGDEAIKASIADTIGKGYSDSPSSATDMPHGRRITGDGQR